MRIGVEAPLRRSDGGVFQATLLMLESFDRLRSQLRDELVLFVSDPEDEQARTFGERGWEVRTIAPPGFLGRAAYSLETRLALQRRRRSQSRDLAPVRRWVRPRWLRQNNIDLMVYPVPIPEAFECGIPFIMAIYDLQHRLQPHFPEVAAGGEWERREYLFLNAAKEAISLIAVSDIGVEHILRFYGDHISQEQIHVLPHLPANYLASEVPNEDVESVRSHYALPERFLFYPASPWPHKNHLSILQALALANEHSTDQIEVIFSGAAGDPITTKSMELLTASAKELGVEQQVRWIGYVPDDHMAALYQAATALVMPTFFGPVNIPVLEAWALSCPVITSDIEGIREHAGDGALLVDPASPSELCQAMVRVWTDEDLRKKLVTEGTARLREFPTEDFDERLQRILVDAGNRLKRPR